jgi:polyisoprenoid-binding protein YceI
MIKILSTTLLVALTTAAAAQSTFVIDTAATKLVWTARKVTGQHHGGIKVRSGTVSWSGNGLLGAEVTIDMGSITDADMEGEWAAKLVHHLKSPDFFDTDAFNTATFRTTKVEEIAGAETGKPNYSVTGDLTIKGVTGPVTFNTLAWQERRGVRAAGTIVFDRTVYGIKFRSGNFFEGLGDKMIDDMVELTFDLSGN